MTTDYTSEVTQLYQAIQYRAPDARDLTNDVTLLSTGQATVVQIASDIDADPYTVNVVDAVIREYQAAFGRVPDQAGVAFWSGVVAADPSQLNTLSETFANSDEFHQLYGATAETPALNNTDLVYALYENVLGRTPDPAGLTFWESQTLNAAQLLEDFAQSPEFIADTAPYITAYQFLEAEGIPPSSGSLFTIETQGVADGGVQLINGWNIKVTATPSATYYTFAVGSIADLDSQLKLVSAHNGGSASASATYDDTGLWLDTLDASGGNFTTTYNNLTNVAFLQADAGNTDAGGNVVVTQAGGNPVLALVAAGDMSINSLTYGDNALPYDTPTLLLLSLDGSISIGSVIDASDRGLTIEMIGNHDITVGGVTDADLYGIYAANLDANLTLTVDRAGLSITGTSFGDNHITADGANDHIVVGDSTGATPGEDAEVDISAGGAGDGISTSNGSGSIAAAGVQDVFAVSSGAGVYIITGNGSDFSSHAATQLGANDNISVDDATVHAWLGANSAVNLSDAATVDLHLLGDTAGASLTNLTTITSSGEANGIRLHFNDVDATGTSLLTETWAGGQASMAQINVAAAASLADALNLAASQAAPLNAHTGLLDWFQYGGNTYIVEAVNSSAFTATHAGLEANDIVVGLTGLTDVSSSVDVALGGG